jgi:magnesium transporter
MIPTPGSAASRPLPASHSSSKQRPQLSSDYPLSDNKANDGLMGGRAPGAGPVPVSETTSGETRLEHPADNGAGKPSKSSKRKKNRNRKRRNRHQSFLTPSREEAHDSAEEHSGAGVRDSMEADRPTSRDTSFFKFGRNLSNTSLESDALLDHRYVLSGI